MERIQVNVRITAEIAEALDERRMEMRKTFGKIPSRSELIRIAIEEFLKEK